MTMHHLVCVSLMFDLWPPLASSPALVILMCYTIMGRRSLSKGWLVNMVLGDSCKISLKLLQSIQQWFYSTGPPSHYIINCTETWQLDVSAHLLNCNENRCTVLCSLEAIEIDIVRNIMTTRVSKDSSMNSTIPSSQYLFVFSFEVPFPFLVQSRSTLLKSLKQYAAFRAIFGWFFLNSRARIFSTSRTKRREHNRSA